MSEIVAWLKNVYPKVKTNEFEWKNIYFNNMPCNGVTGIYTDMFFKEENEYTYIKYSIEYCSRCDKKGVSHPEEGIRYFVLHELKIDNLDEKFDIPEPSNTPPGDGSAAYRVNSYGRFRYVFDDEETAKSVAVNELLMWIYSYTYILSEEELDEWECSISKKLRRSIRNIILKREKLK